MTRTKKFISIVFFGHVRKTNNITMCMPKRFMQHKMAIYKMEMIFRESLWRSRSKYRSLEKVG